MWGNNSSSFVMAKYWTTGRIGFAILVLDVGSPKGCLENGCISTVLCYMASEMERGRQCRPLDYSSGCSLSDLFRSVGDVVQDNDHLATHAMSQVALRMPVRQAFSGRRHSLQGEAASICWPLDCSKDVLIASRLIPGDQVRHRECRLAGVYKALALGGFGRSSGP